MSHRNPLMIPPWYRAESPRAMRYPNRWRSLIHRVWRWFEGVHREVHGLPAHRKHGRQLTARERRHQHRRDVQASRRGRQDRRAVREGAAG